MLFWLFSCICSAKPNILTYSGYVNQTNVKNKKYSFSKALFVVSSLKGDPKFRVKDASGEYFLNQTSPSVYLTSEKSNIDIEIHENDEAKISIANLGDYCLTTFISTKPTFNYTFYSMDYSVEHCVFYAPAEDNITLQFNDVTNYISIFTNKSFYQLDSQSKIFTVNSPVLIRYSTDNSWHGHKINMQAYVNNLDQLKSDRVNFSGKPHHSSTSKWSSYGIKSFIMPIIGSIVPMILLYSWVHGFLMVMKKGGKARTQS